MAHIRCGFITQSILREEVLFVGVAFCGWSRICEEHFTQEGAISLSGNVAFDLLMGEDADVFCKPRRSSKIPVELSSWSCPLEKSPQSANLSGKGKGDQ